MATSQLDPIQAGRNNVFDRIRIRIEEKFSCIVQNIIDRKLSLLQQLNEWEQQYSGSQSEIVRSLEELKSEKVDLEMLLSRARAETSKKCMIEGITQLMRQISEKDEDIPKITFNCETNKLEWLISNLGVLNIVENKIIPSKNYDLINKPLKRFGKFGSGKEKFNNPRGVLVEEDRIFIVDMSNSRIQVFTLEGEYVNEFGKKELIWPWEIARWDNFLFVSDVKGNSLTKWHFREFSMEKHSRSIKGSNPGQLVKPSGLAVDDEEIFVVEYGNNRVSVFDLDLQFKRTIVNNAICESNALRVSNNTVYIVERTGRIKLFSKTGQLLSTIKKNPIFSNLICHFNFDFEQNFLISDSDKNCLFILSPEGNLLHSIHFKTFKLDQPYGVGVTRDGNIVMSFQGGNSPGIAIL